MVANARKLVVERLAARTSRAARSFNVMLASAEGVDPGPARDTTYLAGIRTFLEELARAAGVGDPATFARTWHILMKASIVAAGEGDAEAARRARAVARLVLEHEPAPVR